MFGSNVVQTRKSTGKERRFNIQTDTVSTKYEGKTEAVPLSRVLRLCSVIDTLHILFVETYGSSGLGYTFKTHHANAGSTVGEMQRRWDTMRRDAGAYYPVIAASPSQSALLNIERAMVNHVNVLMLFLFSEPKMEEPKMDKPTHRHRDEESSFSRSVPILDIEEEEREHHDESDDEE